MDPGDSMEPDSIADVIDEEDEPMEFDGLDEHQPLMGHQQAPSPSRKNVPNEQLI